MTKAEIEKFIGALGFSLTDGKKEYWKAEINECIIGINLEGEKLNEWKINYDSKIKTHRQTTCNFSQSENLVVLECVVRLLKKGYSAKNIELEKKWRVGGFLDIYVTNNEGEAYLMIECKTWGKEYSKALKITLENNTNKEQILNYYLQDQNAKYLCLYTSHLTSTSELDYLSSIIHTSDFIKAQNQVEIHEIWDNVFYTKGIFEPSINAYNINFLGIVNSDLKSIDHSYLSPENNDDGSIFNRFAEILRRHTISDKSNAYNKIFNLFLCKIVDEDNAVDENYEMEFQWKYDENPVNVIYRLSDLHKRGMKDYMELDVADVSEEDFDRELLKIASQTDGETQEIKNMFKQLRLYKNNEFAFKEVINERTFYENAEIVKEVVKLLETFKIKYEHKQKFLGDFFERLLNIGIKQESGQFFTPTPITTFICNSIPFEKVIENKINLKDNNFLPYVIDYACGSGHFLNDAMDRIDKILQSKKIEEFKTITQKYNFRAWNQAYKWAKEFVYGIEKDYRLAKTTKVACFLNGDGEAKILYGDGLAPFNSKLYYGKLNNETGDKQNPVFDAIVANPPFSVESFRMVLENGKETFDLYDQITDKSDDIECLFIERTSQLLKENGFAGIILPSTILLNRGIHQKARKLLLENFKICGLCEFGTKAFTYAGQPTIALFIKKREKVEIDKINVFLSDFKKKETDFSFDGIKNIISQYILLNTQFENLVDFTEKIKDDKIWKHEKEKLRIFLLNTNNKVVIGNAGDKDRMKNFLGYEHSSMTKYEGVHPYPYNDTGKIISKMYDEELLLNPEKLNTLIYNNFLNEPITVPDSLKEYVEIKEFNEMLDFSDVTFDYRVYMQSLKNPYLEFKNYPLTSLSDSNICEILDHKRKPVKKSKRGSGDYAYYGATGKTGMIDDFLFNEKLVLIGEDGAKWNKGDNTAFIIEGKSWVNNHAHIVKTNNEKLIEEYLQLIFANLDLGFLKTRPNGGKLQKGEMMKIRFPLPNVETQLKIISEVNALNGNDKWNKFEQLLV
jgi:type I restriction enzyme M protein